MTSGEVRRRRGCKASGAAVVGDGVGTIQWEERGRSGSRGGVSGCEWGGTARVRSPQG